MAVITTKRNLGEERVYFRRAEKELKARLQTHEPKQKLQEEPFLLACPPQLSSKAQDHVPSKGTAPRQLGSTAPDLPVSALMEALSQLRLLSADVSSVDQDDEQQQTTSRQVTKNNQPPPFPASGTLPGADNHSPSPWLTFSQTPLPSTEESDLLLSSALGPSQSVSPVSDSSQRH